MLVAMEAANVLHEVDYLPTVSGGGFAAAAYIETLIYHPDHGGTHRDYSLATWLEKPAVGIIDPDDHLKRHLERGYKISLLWGFLNPKTWFRNIDRGDFLENRDYISLPIPANQYYDLEKGLGEISHRHVAMAAGIGRLGRGGFLVTPQYGGAVQLITVLTTAKLKPDSILEENPCKGCPQPCVSICPVKALTPDRDRVMKMDGKEYRYGWLSYLRCQWGMRRHGNGKSILCPFGSADACNR